MFCNFPKALRKRSTRTMGSRGSIRTDREDTQEADPIREEDALEKRFVAMLLHFNEGMGESLNSWMGCDLR